MSRDDDFLRAARFEQPQLIPMHFHINPACWQHYDQQQLQELMAAHPLLFPDFVPAPLPIQPQFAAVARADQDFIDDWGCLWRTSENGITGSVVRHPLANWQDLPDFSPPDPGKVCGIGALDWATVAENFAQCRQTGKLRIGGLRHGHTFLQLCNLRGYENLTYDMIDAEPRLQTLCDMVETFNAGIVQRYLQLDVQCMQYPEDLGMQHGPMLSPDCFRKYIKPSYQRLMQPARQHGCLIHMHSDGDIRTLVDDLIDGGVDIINLQDLVNGIDWIGQRLAGKVCIELDIDRQQITPFGSVGEIDALIRTEVETLGSRDGGLMMVYGLYPGVPIANVAAVIDAMQRYADYYA